MDLPVTFSAQTETGRGRGKDLSIPTINLHLDDVPANLKDGIYACFAVIDGKQMKAAMHLGPRPVFADTKTCEIHLIDETIPGFPDTAQVTVIAFLRPVLNFNSTETLVMQIKQDIADARVILAAHAQ